DATRASILRSGFNTFEAITSYGGSAGTFGGIGVEYQRKYAQASAASVAPNFFDAIGARILRGRGFADSDGNGATQPVVITQALEKTLFADGESAVGTVIDVDGTPAPVVGVVSNAAHLPERHPDVYRLPPPGTVLTSLPSNIVRLRKDVSPEA